MKITGYHLMDRIEALREEAQTINGQFTSSLFRFANATEEKPEPRALMTSYSGKASVISPPPSCRLQH